MKKKHSPGVRLYFLLVAAVILSGCASAQLSEEAISRIRDVKRIGVIQVLPAEARWDYYGTTIFHNSNEEIPVEFLQPDSIVMANIEARLSEHGYELVYHLNCAERSVAKECLDIKRAVDSRSQSAPVDAYLTIIPGTDYIPNNPSPHYIGVYGRSIALLVKTVSAHSILNIELHDAETHRSISNHHSVAAASLSREFLTESFSDLDDAQQTVLHDSLVESIRQSIDSGLDKVLNLQDAATSSVESSVDPSSVAG